MEEFELAMFNSFDIPMTLDQALSASHAWSCDEDVKALLRCPELSAWLDKINPEHIAQELKEYGAWDSEELKDVEANRERIVWLAACQIREEN